ncbi:MAG: MerR family transcriptional regulator [Planctomycetota bacterium]
MSVQTKSPDSRLLKIGEFARRAGTNLRTLRYYEEIGLLTPTSRSKGGFRFYRESDANRLAMVQTLQGLGLHLDRICEVMGTRNGGRGKTTFFDRVRAALEEQDHLLSERIEELHGQRKSIRQAFGKLAECEKCAVIPDPGNNFCDPCPGTGLPLPGDLSALF